MKQISMRQMMVLLFLALATLGAETLPEAGRAGGIAWLGPVLAGAVLLAISLWLLRKPQGGSREDLGKRMRRALGDKAGRGVMVLFLLWALVLLVVNAARCANRIQIGGGTTIFYSGIVLLLVIWMGVGKFPAFARACEIFALAVGVGLAALVVFALFRIQPSYVFLFTPGELARVSGVAAASLGIASVGGFALFLAGDITVREGDGRRMARWLVLLFVTFAVSLLLVLGRFGAPLAGSLERPFFQMVAGVGLSGAFQRLESLVAALWVLGDLALLGLLLFVCRRLTGEVLGRREARWPAVAAGVLAFVGGELLAGRTGMLRWSQEVLMPWGTLAAGVILCLLLGFCRWRERNHKSNGRQEESQTVQN